MLTGQLFDQAAQALWLTVICSALPLAAALATGFLISLFQAATQIQEQTLSFVPKLVVVGLVLWLGAPMLDELIREFLDQNFTELVNLHVARR